MKTLVFITEHYPGHDQTQSTVVDYDLLPERIRKRVDQSIRLDQGISFDVYSEGMQSIDNTEENCIVRSNSVFDKVVVKYATFYDEDE